MIHPAAGLSKSNALRNGDTVTVLTGIMSYGYNAYRIMPIADVAFVKDNARPSDMPVVGGNLQVASINVLNYFRTVDDGGNSCGTHSQGCRGADSVAELNMKSRYHRR